MYSAYYAPYWRVFFNHLEAVIFFYGHNSEALETIAISILWVVMQLGLSLNNTCVCGVRLHTDSFIAKNTGGQWSLVRRLSNAGRCLTFYRPTPLYYIIICRTTVGFQLYFLNGISLLLFNDFRKF